MNLNREKKRTEKVAPPESIFRFCLFSSETINFWIGFKK